MEGKMMILLRIYSLCLFVGFSSINAQEIWSRKADFGGTARTGAVGFSIGDKGYVVTGWGESEYHKDFWEYDPSQNTWTQRADFDGVGRTGAIGFSIGDEGYIGTGYYFDGEYQLLPDFWEYNSQSNSWTRKGDFPGPARFNAVGFSIGDKGYVGTGIFHGRYGPLFNDFWEYNPVTDSWLQKDDFPGEKRHDAVGFTIDGKGYIGTGYGHKDLWEYNPETGNWTRKADFDGAYRSRAVGFAINGKGYIGTGDGTASYRDFWEYDPYRDLWIRKSDFSGGEILAAVGFSIGDKGYIGTGSYYDNEWNFHVLSDFWEYDPSRDIYPQVPELINPSDAAILVRNQNVGMKWARQWDADSHHLQVSYDNDFLSLVVNEENLIENVYTISLLDFNTTYYWRVRSRNEAGESGWSGMRSFTTAREKDPWTRIADFGGTARNAPVAFTIGNKGYVGTGYAYEGGLTGEYSVDLWAYDPSEDVWTQKADFQGIGRESAVGFSIGDKGYIGTGYYYDEGRQLLSDFWQYDSQSNTWTQKAAFPGTARLNAVGLSIGNRGYVGTGEEDWDSWFKDFWEYNPETDNWEQKADFPGQRRQGAVGFSIDNRGYIGTGYGDFKDYKDFWEYYPATGDWTRKADFAGEARSAAVSFVIDGKGYIGTGVGMGLHRDFWEYNPQTDNWKRKADLSGMKRYNAVGFSVAEKGYVGTGLTGPVKDFWEYDPSKDVLPHVPVLISPVTGSSGHSIQNITLRWAASVDSESYHVQVATISDFMTIFVDEQNLSGTSYTLPSLELGTTYFWRVRAVNIEGESDWSVVWNFTTSVDLDGLWTRKSDFAGTPRTDAVGFSINDKGYIGTGYDGTYRKDFWEYDPETDSWTQRADFGGDGRSSAVGFSIGDKGYIGTGWDGDDLLKDFWEYDTETNIWIQKSDLGGGARRGAVGFSIGDKGYIGTGFRVDFWEYDPVLDSWTQKADFKGEGEKRRNAVGFSIGNKGFVGTGVTGPDYWKSDFWEYDPQNDTWTRKSNFGGTSRYGAIGFSIGDKGYIGLGGYWVEPTNDFWRYDPHTDTWNRKTDFKGMARFNAVGFSIGERGYVGTGGHQTKDIWEFDPTRNDTTTNVPDGNGIISEYRLYQNYPNPFNPSTVIGYAVPERGHVRLTVYNIAGQRVATLVNEEQPAQFYEVTFNASNLSSGMYIYLLQVGNFQQSKRMIYIK
jgi:N-acetylneuraminic acid mutarotase